jgi:hypothetical protein
MAWPAQIAIQDDFTSPITSKNVALKWVLLPLRPFNYSLNNALFNYRLLQQKLHANPAGFFTRAQIILHLKYLDLLVELIPNAIGK